jgi:hypothetical protein
MDLSLWGQSRSAVGRPRAALSGLGNWVGARDASPRCYPPPRFFQFTSGCQGAQMSLLQTRRLGPKWSSRAWTRPQQTEFGSGWWRIVVAARELGENQVVSFLLWCRRHACNPRTQADACTIIGKVIRFLSSGVSVTPAIPGRRRDACTTIGKVGPPRWRVQGTGQPARRVS